MLLAPNKRLVERLNDSNHRVELPEGAEKYQLPDIPLPDDLEHLFASVRTNINKINKIVIDMLD